MDRKKRKASGGRATNSNQKYSTVEVGDKVTMDNDGTNVVDLDEDGEQLDCVEVAWLLPEKMHDFVEGGKGGRPGLESRSLRNVADSRKIVSVDSKKLSPVLWRTLPKELLARVLARLPLRHIPRLRSLSKEWRRDMATVNSDINRALDEANPTMVAFFSWGDVHSSLKFAIQLCDLSFHRSRDTYRLHVGDCISRRKVEDRWNDMGARDGGLVCFASTWKPSKDNPLCIVVVNLLTRVRRKLPSLQYVYPTPPEMMHIEVDSETKCYRVVVVGKDMKGHPTVEMYDSGAKHWTKETPPVGFIFGLAYRWEYNKSQKTFLIIRIIPSLYGFAEGQLKPFYAGGPFREASVIKYALQKDCMFVLHRNTSSGEMLPPEGFHTTKYCMTKYRIQSNAEDWVQERSYLCSRFGTLLEEDIRSMTLIACEGFLMLLPSFRDNARHFWLLDLSTGEWSRLPDCFQGHKYKTTIIRASWNVVP